MARTRRHLSLDDAAHLHELALRERAAGRPADALAACHETLAIVERELGESSRETARVLTTLGLVQQDLSEYAAAEVALLRAAVILAGVDGDDAELVGLRLRTTSGLAGLRRVQGRLEEAERLFLEAIAVAEDTLALKTASSRRS
jgi:tetratricopeptide (TPR) repeat protein